MVLSTVLTLTCGSVSVFGQDEAIYADTENENKDISENDIVDLVDFLNEYSFLMSKGYDYKFTDYNTVVETAADIVLRLNDDNYVNAIEKEITDPLNKLAVYSDESYYYEINSNIVDWYITNIFNKKPDHNYIGTDNYDGREYIRYYYYNEKYYFAPISIYAEQDKWGFFEDIECQKLNDGRYYIKFIDKETENIKKYILAELIEKEDKKCWGFYNISNNPVLLAEYSIDENSLPVMFNLSGKKVQLYINGEKINIEDEEKLPVVYVGNIYIPVCGVSDILNIGANKVSDCYSGEWLSINISTDNRVCKNIIESCYLYIDNSKSVRYRYQSHIIDDRYMMPVQMFFTALGGFEGSYEWNKKENYVNIIAPGFSVNEKLTEIKAKFAMAEEKDNYIKEDFLYGGETSGTVYRNSETSMIEKIHIDEYFSRYTYDDMDLYFDNNEIYFYSVKNYDYVINKCSEIKCYFDEGKLIRCEGEGTLEEKEVLLEQINEYMRIFKINA